MKTMQIISCLAFLSLSLTLQAIPETQTWTDGNGLVWTYTETNGKVTLGQSSVFRTAIPTSTSGALVIPSSIAGKPVVALDNGAFEYCKYLTSVTIPDSVVNIGWNAFYGCSGLTSIKFGSGVKSIGGSSFVQCTKLTSVTIPNNVIEIGFSAFSGCSSLSKVSIGSNVNYIGNGAFYGTALVKNSTGLCVVNNCLVAVKRSSSSSTTITIPSNVRLIAEMTLSDAYWLTSIYVESSNSYFSSNNGVLYDKNKTRLITYPGSKTGSFFMPSSVRTIESYAFFGCSKLTSVTIPNGVVHIGHQAFSCTGLTSASVPNSVTNIEDGAFCYCSSLSSLNIGNGVTHIGGHILEDTPLLNNHSPGNVIIGDCLLEYKGDCPASVSIPSGIRLIADEAFIFKNLQSIQLPDSLKYIGGSAFSCCSALKSIKMPSSVQKIGREAFYSCTSLSAVYADDVMAWCGIDFEDKDANPLYYAHRLYIAQRQISVSSLFLPKGSINLKPYSFAGCTSLGAVVVPASCSCIIGDDAFIESSLRSVYYARPKSEAEVRQAFSNCGLPQLDFIEVDHIPIGSSSDPWLVGFDNDPVVMAWTNGTGRLIVKGNGRMKTYSEFGTEPEWHAVPSITSVEFGHDVVEIGRCSFMCMTNISEITIHKSMQSIGEYAFYECTGLKRVCVDQGDIDRVKSLLRASGFDVSAVAFVENMTVAPERLSDGYVSEPYSFQLTAEGGRGSYSWRLSNSWLEPQRSYEIESGWAYSFANVGTSRGWNGDDACWTCELPFAFPFFGKKYTKAWISTNGTITFDGSYSGFRGSLDVLKSRAIIAPMWTDLYTSIYIKESADSVTVRWSGSFVDDEYDTYGSVNFSAELFRNGNIVFSYDGGCDYFHGISAGDGIHYAVLDGSYRTYFLIAPPDASVDYGLPNGLAMNANGMISGAPSVAGTNIVRVAVTDAAGKSVERDLEIIIVAEKPCTVVPGSVTGGAEIKVANDWQDKFPSFVERFGSDFSAALAKKSGKLDGDGHEMFVWQDYVVGTDPTDENDVFRITSFSMENGTPKIEYYPELSDREAAQRKYTIYGKSSLADKEWTVVGGDGDKYNFFKVAVEMK